MNIHYFVRKLLRTVYKFSFIHLFIFCAGLKVGPRGQNCTSSPCVEHSTCDLGNTDRCVCDSNYGSKMDGSCGTLSVGQSSLKKTPSLSNVICPTCANIKLKSEIRDSFKQKTNKQTKQPFGFHLGVKRRLFFFPFSEHNH